MAEQQLSWRRQPATSSSPLQHGSQPSKSPFYNNKGDSRFANNWRNKGSTAHSQSRSSHLRENSAPGNEINSEKVHRPAINNVRPKNTETDRGPAVPLFPLRMSYTRPLPHPSTYAGADNWALTPTSSIPSLPATPSRAMQALGWANSTYTEEEQSKETSGSRGLSAARANLNRRNEDDDDVEDEAICKFGNDQRRCMLEYTLVAFTVSRWRGALLCGMMSPSRAE